MKKDEKKILHRALDGEVTKSETKRFKRKLQTDLKAREEYEQLKQVVQASGSVQVEVPADFTKKVMKGVHETTRIHRPPPPK